MTLFKIVLNADVKSGGKVLLKGSVLEVLLNNSAGMKCVDDDGDLHVIAKDSDFYDIVEK